MSSQQLKFTSILHHKRNVVQLLSYTLLFLVVLIIVTSLVLRHGENRQRNNILSTLHSMHNTVEESVNVWESDLQGTIKELSKSPEIIECAQELVGLPADREILENHPSQTRIRALVRPFINAQGFRGIFVISPERKNVASLRKNNLGKVNIIQQEWPILLDRMFKGETVITSPVPSEVPLKNEAGEMQENYPTMFIGSPIRNTNGDILGVLTLRIDPVHSLSRITKAARFRSTGETYMIDKRGRLLTESRYPEEIRNLGLINPNESEIFNLRIAPPEYNLSEQLLQEQHFTRAAHAVLQEEAGGAKVAYSDYRGVPVLGSWGWDSTLNVGIITKIDEVEALDLFVTLRRWVMLLILFLISLSFGLIFIIYLNWKHSDKELTLLYHAIESSYVAISITDNQSRYLYVNEAFTSMFGYSSEEVIGLTPRIIQSDQTPQSVRKELRETIRAGKTWQGDVADKAKDGHSIWGTLTISPIHDNKKSITHYVSVLQDTTEHRQMVHDLRVAKSEQEKANKVKDEFFANINHEIRTPLNIISGMLYLLKTKFPQIEETTYIKKIEMASENITTVLKQILEFSNLVTKTEELHEDKFSPMVLLDVIEGDFAKTAEDKGLGFSLYLQSTIPRIIVGDRIRIVNLARSLVDNAIKFTEKGKVSFEVLYMPEEEYRGELMIRVADTGIGIHEEDWDIIFKPFIQVDGSSTREHSGTGIGLSLCQKNAELLQGEISVESIYGKGSVFTFTCPIEALEDENLHVRNDTADLVKHTTTHEDKVSKGSSHVALRPQLEELLTLLKQSDADAIELAQEIFVENHDFQEFRPIHGSILKYDFDTAIDGLSRYLESENE